jgi:UDP-N-acetylmuramoyl-L-alanyl-D-glutamate--2,6-diaminopimelate ligase
MTFRELLRGVEISAEVVDPGLGEREITGVQYDSRLVQCGNVFVAMKGERTDGNCYMDAAVAKGAIAIVSDSPTEPLRAGVAWVRVPHGRRALAKISANLFKQPANNLTITGITGTNGKTTTSFLLAQMLHLLGRGEVVLIGTVEYHFAGKIVPAPHTTPESLELNRIFAAATDPGLGKLKASEAVMEVSSHALDQERVYGIPFEIAVFTNLTRDHLDYHGNMEKYFAAKARLFAGLGSPAPKLAVINSDDEYGRKLIETSRTAGSLAITYGLGSGDVRAQDVVYSAHGTKFVLHTAAGSVEVRSPLVGRVNVYNLLAAIATMFARESNLDAIAATVGALQGAPGRFERIDEGQPFTVVVDYAHTHDALRNLTELAREFVGRRGRVITLFGCGGDRDKTKRPLMGRAAGENSDFVVLTSDNPRSEDPNSIIAEAVAGLRQTSSRHAVEPDRRRAITLAIADARPGDIVLIAGKGHEKVQVTRGGSLPFDDVQVAREALHAEGYGLATSNSRRQTQ